MRSSWKSFSAKVQAVVKLQFWIAQRVYVFPIKELLKTYLRLVNQKFLTQRKEGLSCEYYKVAKQKSWKSRYNCSIIKHLIKFTLAWLFQRYSNVYSFSVYKMKLKSVNVRAHKFMHASKIHAVLNTAIVNYSLPFVQ